MPLLTPAQFLDELRKVQFKTFPNISGRGTITGEGLSPKNAYKYTRVNAHTSFPFELNYATYEYFYGKSGIKASDVAIRLGTYKDYKNFWMALMVTMSLAKVTNVRPATIDM